MKGRICVACDSSTTLVRKDGYEDWRSHDGDWFCKKCYCKYVYGPVYYPKKSAKWNPINNPKYHPRRLWFKGKRIILKENPRKGICQNCGKTDCKTDMHHKEYHIEDPLKDTIELCASCHWRQHENVPSRKLVK